MAPPVHPEAISGGFKRNVVIPVEWGDLSRDTFMWYVKNLHFEDNFVHVCHVPDFRRYLQPGMTPPQVMEVMIETNAVSDELKKVYESLLADKNIKGKFFRVGGNNRWSAIVEYCKLVNATLLVLGTQPKPTRGLSSNQKSAKEAGMEARGSRRGSQRSSRRLSTGEQILQDVGPFSGTVTHDVLQHCATPTVVYRHHHPPDAQGGMYSHRGSLKRKSV